MKEMNKNYPMVDIFKFIAALMVMVIHFRPFSDVNPTLDFTSAQIVSRMAVPFFLICAGYFLAQKDMRKTALKLLKLYGIWSLIYLPIVLIGATYNQTGWGTDFLLIVRDIFFQGTTLHLWYLPAVVFAIFLIAWLRKFMDLKKILILSLILYGIGLFTDGYYGVLSQLPWMKVIADRYLLIFASGRNGLFFAFPFLALGLTIHETEVFSRITLKQAWIGFFFSFMALFAEVIILENFAKPFDYNMFLFLIPVAFFLLAIGLKQDVEERPIHLNLRSMSSLMYFSHILVFYLLMSVISGLGLWVLFSNSLVRTLLTALMTIWFSKFVIKRANMGKKLSKSLY